MREPVPHLPVLILFNKPETDRSSCHESEAGVLNEVNAVASALEKRGVPFRVQGLSSLRELTDILVTAHESVIFNLVEEFPSQPLSANLIPRLCEVFGKTCTGNTTECMLLSQNKWHTNAILRTAGLPVPPGVLIAPGDSLPGRYPFTGPYIVKPVEADASEGIDTSSIADRPGKTLNAAIARVHRQFKQPALVEKMIGRRELNVALMQSGNKVRVLTVAEIDFSSFAPHQPAIVDYAAKWIEDSFEFKNTPRIIPAPLPRKLYRQVENLALKAWQIVKCRDYARVDFRLDNNLHPVILEVNPNPDISPDGGFAAALRHTRTGFSAFVTAMISNALSRQASSVSSPPPERSRQKLRSATFLPAEETPSSIRRVCASDRTPILQLLEDTGFFRPDEIDIAREVLDESISKGPTGHYQSFSIVDQDDQPSGWICFGPTPCTLGTFDIYWIAVAPQAQGKGLGRQLLLHAEKLIMQRKGRISIIETSGRAVYDSTRGFYLRLGYKETARINDFYAPQDDKVVYIKTLE